MRNISIVHYALFSFFHQTDILRWFAKKSSINSIKPLFNDDIYSRGERFGRKRFENDMKTFLNSEIALHKDRHEE